LPPFEEILVVRSNHDDFLDRWLQSGRPEPGSRKFYHFLSYWMLEGYDQTGEFPIGIELALRSIGAVPDNVKFLGLNDNYLLHDIQMAMHGHKGVNGAKGGKSLSRIGSRSMFGHTHSPFIWQGANCVGLSAQYNQGYNGGGASSWLQTHGLVLANGYRQMLHMIGSFFRG
jgi:hypothetical protein